MNVDAIQVSGLNFGFGGPLILKNLSLELPRGSRCLLVGANGAGKSTLLKILAGKTLVKGNCLSILGKNPFSEGSVGITYLGSEWAHNPVVKGDVPVSRLLMSLGAQRHKDRCSKLLEIMDVNPNWHMHEVSDGQRRRVQIVLGLMEPWDVLLLDEVTVDLDVIARADLLAFLKDETETRGATIVYATHIFDGISSWATHVAHITDGTVDFVRHVDFDFPEFEALKSSRSVSASTPTKMSAMQDSMLLTIVDGWLRKDREAEKRKGPQTEEKPKTKWDILSDNWGQVRETTVLVTAYLIHAL